MYPSAAGPPNLCREERATGGGGEGGCSDEVRGPPVALHGTTWGNRGRVSAAGARGSMRGVPSYRAGREASVSRANVQEWRWGYRKGRILWSFSLANTGSGVTIIDDASAIAYYPRQAAAITSMWLVMMPFSGEAHMEPCFMSGQLAASNLGSMLQSSGGCHCHRPCGAARPAPDHGFRHHG